MYFKIYLNNKYNIIMGYFLQKKKSIGEFVQVHVITCMSVFLNNIVFNKHLSFFIFNWDDYYLGYKQ